MIHTKYTDMQQDPNFDWSLYENGYNGKNLVPNRSVKTNNGDGVYCHELYAQQLYDRMEAHFSGQVYTPKDQITGSIYNVKSITQVSDHEVRLDTFGGMSAVVDINKVHQIIDSIGCGKVKNFMLALKDRVSKEISI